MRPASIALICAAGLAGLTLVVAIGQPVPGEFDLVRLIVSCRNEPLTAFIQALTFITSAAPALLITLALSAVEVLSRWRRGEFAGPFRGAARAVAGSFAYWPALAYAGALVCNIALRIAIGRLPPEVDYIPHVLPELRADFQRFAFPSGHAGAAVAAYVSAALVIAGHWPRARRWTWAAAIVIIAGTGCGRVYLGVHWPTDVVGGFLLAGMWLALSIHIRDNAIRRAGSSETQHDMMRKSINQYFQTCVPLIEREMRDTIERLRDTQGRQPAVLATMLNYHLGFASVDGSPASANTGKRIRPALTLLCCEASGGSMERALPAAAAIELLHNFSLIHDDIEDRDELRRGRPALWKIWGEAKAINAGDAMFALAHIALQNAAERGVDACDVLRALRLFDATCVALTMGQHMDIEFEHRADVTAADYLAMIEGKTAALVRAACEIGAIVAGADDDRAAQLGEFGRWLGIAFQVQDDLLGIWGDPALTGKHDSDLAHGKKTLPVLHAADQDQEVRERYFRRRPTDAVELAELRALIEARGGRAYAEQAARDAHDKSLAALAAARVSGESGLLLRALAESLLGRQM